MGTSRGPGDPKLTRIPLRITFTVNDDAVSIGRNRLKTRQVRNQEPGSSNFPSFNRDLAQARCIALKPEEDSAAVITDYQFPVAAKIICDASHLNDARNW